MNATSLLLGMMSVLIIITFVFTLGGLKTDSSKDQERKEILAEVKAIKEEAESLRRLATQRRLTAAAPITPVVQPNYVPPVQPAVQPTPSSQVPVTDEAVNAELEQLRRQLDEAQQANVELEKAAEKAERDKGVAEKEASIAWRERTAAQQKQDRERRRIEIAMKMGEVTSVNTEYGFLFFNPTTNRQFSAGERLGIRRNSGILGLIRVKGAEGSAYLADILPHGYAGGVPAIQEGDEIIVLPATYKAPGEEGDAGVSGPSGEEAPLLELPTR